MLAPELNDQPSVFVVSVLVSEPLVTVKRALSWALLSPRPAVTPLAATVKAVETVLVRSTSPRVIVPEAVRLASLDSVIAPVALSTPSMSEDTRVGVSFVPVTVTTKVLVPVAVTPFVTVRV